MQNIMNGDDKTDFEEKRSHKKERLNCEEIKESEYEIKVMRRGERSNSYKLFNYREPKNDCIMDSIGL